MNKLILVAALALGLGACNPDPNVATPGQEYIGLNAYLAGVKVATQYLRLPLCPTAAPLCRTQAMSQRVYDNLKAARAGKAQIIAALQNNSTVPLTAIQALQAAYAVVQQLPNAQ